MKKIYLNGIPIEVRSMEECEKVEFVVCAKVKDWNMSFPTHGYSTGKCCVCGEEVYFSHSSSPKTPRKICPDCMLGHANGEQSVTE